MTKETNFKNQNYSKLRKHHQDLGVPWRDPEFPANDVSIGTNKVKKLHRKIEWKRPRDLCENPRLFVEGISGRDAHQGNLGNCWFVAACSVLAGSKPLWERVIPDHKGQDWAGEEHEEYSGIFRFRFWRFGKWVQVLVDDQLPTCEGKLLFTHSPQTDEFWGALLEKAYAKLHGSYEALDGGNLSDALVDFTSGVSEIIDIEANGFRTDDLDKKKELFNTMSADIEDHALMCCAIKTLDSSAKEEKTDLGLVRGHAYGITAIRKVPIGGTGLVSFFKGREKLLLVRLQNPWGEKEWSGPFSDKWRDSLLKAEFHQNTSQKFALISRSPEWNNISQKEREKLGLTFNDDGEFWMPFDDFLHQFTDLSICRIPNTSIFSLSKTWQESQNFGAWVKAPGLKNRSGGCFNDQDKFFYNPQYRFDINKEEDEVLVQLSQEDRRNEDHELLVIGFNIFKVEKNRKYRIHKTVPNSSLISSDYIKTQHTFLKTTLSKGRYVIIPTLFEADQVGNYLLRMFTDEDSSVKELTKDQPKKSWYNCCSKEPEIITRIVVKEASGLEKQDTFSNSDPYCLVKCEGSTVRSEVVNNTQEPKFEDCSAIFYQKHPEKPILVQIWNKNYLRDGFLGQIEIKTKPDGKIVRSQRELFHKGSKSDEKKKGTVTLEVESHSNLTAF